MDPTLYGPLLAAASAFAGVLVAQGVVVWSQRRKVHDDDIRQWQAERRTLYVRFLAEVLRLTHSFLNLMQQDKIIAIANLDVADLDELEALGNEIRLISTQAVVEAGEDLSFQVFLHLVELREHALVELGEIVDGDEVPSVQVVNETFNEQQTAVNALRIKFLRAARSELSRPSSSHNVEYFELFPGADLDIEPVRFYEEQRRMYYRQNRQERLRFVRRWARILGRSDSNENDQSSES